MNRETIVTKK